MNNGIDIDLRITEEQFKAKSKDGLLTTEQGWIIFKAIECNTLAISDIDKNGCQFSRNKYLANKGKNAILLLKIFGGSLGVGIPIGLAIYKTFCN